MYAISMYTFSHVYRQTYMSLYRQTLTYAHIHILHTCMYRHVCMYVCIYVYMYVADIHGYTALYVHKYTY